MRWEPGERSPNLEDRRGETAGGSGFPGGIRIGLGGAVVLLVLSVVTGQNFFALLDTGAGPGGDLDAGRSATPYQPSAEEERLVDFVSFVLDDVQSTWTRELPKAGRDYQDAKLVLFNGAVQSGCGFAESAMGPFYCPADRKVYIDLGFYRELKTRFGAPGDFAQAYVIAHEVGHHVQNLLGIFDRVQERRESRPDQAAALSVRLELQADCLAGVWARSTEQRKLLDPGDVEEGIGAAAAVGDDRIQRGAGARVNPETWTHGSSQQRVAWFRQGFTIGQVEACDTFTTRLPADHAA